MKAVLIFLSIYMYSFQVFSQAVLVEEKGRAIQSRPAEGNTYKKISKNGADFKYKRKVGVGFSLAGVQGMAGIDMELNFSPELAFTTSFGISDRFQTFALSVKRSLTGKYFSPYIAGGFARWYTVTEEGPINDTNPGFLAEKFLSAKEKSEGKFAETILYPAIGIQYLQLDGEWAGSSLFAEVLLLMDIDDLQSAATGALGYKYYF